MRVAMRAGTSHELAADGYLAQTTGATTVFKAERLTRRLGLNVVPGNTLSEKIVTPNPIVPVLNSLQGSFFMGQALAQRKRRCEFRRAKLDHHNHLKHTIVLISHTKYFNLLTKDER
jgi:hypothetical protein